MIEGVIIKRLDPHCDERGWFMEGFRSEDFGIDVAQVSFALRVAGIKNGWHVHKNHSELFVVVRGILRLAMRDCREGRDICVDYPRDDLFNEWVMFGYSDTPEQYEEVVMSEYDNVAVLVPAGVAHAYRTFTDTIISYAATETYESSQHDEGRIEPDRWGNEWMRDIEAR